MNRKKLNIKYALIEQKYKPAKSQGANINYVHIIINLQSPLKYMYLQSPKANCRTGVSRLDSSATRLKRRRISGFFSRIGVGIIVNEIFTN